MLFKELPTLSQLLAIHLSTAIELPQGTAPMLAATVARRLLVPSLRFAARSITSFACEASEAHHFNVRALYLGSDVDTQKATDKLTQRCLASGKDFAVFSLGPISALQPGHEQLLSPAQHVVRYGAMVAFRFGSVVFFQPHRPADGAHNSSTVHDGDELTADGSESVTGQQHRSLHTSAAAASASGSTKAHANTQGSKHPSSGHQKLGMPGGKPAPRAPLPSQVASEADHLDCSKDNQAASTDPAVSHVAPGSGSAPSSSASGPGAFSWDGQDSPQRSVGQDEAALALEVELKRAIRTVVTDPVASTPRTEEASIVLRPHMKHMFSKETNRMAIRELDLGVLEVVCRVIGQSAALDFYTTKVGDSLRDFDKVLADLAENAGKPFYQRPLLFRRLRGGKLLATIASSSLMYNKIVSKLGLLDTSRTAWESDIHDVVWKGMKKEYELEQRFENLLKKLDIYKEETRFILEVRNGRGSTAAELAIIALISVEIMANTYFHYS